MLVRDIFKILALYLFGFSATLLLPLAMAFYFEHVDHPQPHPTAAFMMSWLFCFGLGIIFFGIGRHASGHLYRKEGLIAVVLIWFLTPAIAALPFYWSGTLTNPYQAFFEAASGLSTTGSTVMTPKKYNAEGVEVPIEEEFCGQIPEKYVYYGTIAPVRDSKTGAILYEGVEAVGKALLFWRSFIQWLGGLGIIVLFVAILPLLGVGARVLYQAEVPGPVKDALTPRVKETASFLWKIYLGISIAEVVLLMATNGAMPLFDAVCITFSTMSTGGFTVRNGSIGAYHNLHTEWVVMIFMVLGSINFTSYFYAIRGQFYRIFEPEFFLYACVLSFICLFATWNLVGTPVQPVVGEGYGIYGWLQAARYGFFQMISTQTSTGFVTANYDAWPYAIQVLMVIAMYAGGMAGSTAGGIKMIRHYLALRIVQNKVESLFRPDAVRLLRIGGREVDEKTVSLVMTFILIVLAFSIVGIFLYVLEGMSPETALGLTACMINNIGLSFRVAGPQGSCAFLSDFGCVVSSMLMILGRLEFFAVLALLVPAFWRQNR